MMYCVFSQTSFWRYINYNEIDRNEMVIIGKDTLTLEYFEDGQKMTLEIDHEVNSITKYMDHIVYIEDGVTIKDIFVHMGKDIDTIDIVFDASLGGHNFSDFLDEAMLDPVPDDLLQFAVFEHACNMESDELLHEIRFVVIGNHPEEDKMVPYSVELSAINAFTELVVKVDTLFSINKYETINDEIVELNLFEAHKPMTLYEILSALLFEVSYYGNPEMRQIAFEEMKSQVLARLSDDDTELSGIIISANKEEDIKSLEIQLEKSILDEDYETSAALRDKINDLKGKGRNKNK